MKKETEDQGVDSLQQTTASRDGQKREMGKMGQTSDMWLDRSQIKNGVAARHVP